MSRTPLAAQFGNQTFAQVRRIGKVLNDADSPVAYPHVVQQTVAWIAS